MCKEKKEKSIIELLGITPGPWDNSELDEGKFLISKDECSLLSTHDEYDPTQEQTRPWGIFNRKEDSLLCAAAPELLDDLIESCIVIERYKRTSPYFLKADEEILNRKIKIIEKACYPKSWEDIQCLKK